MCFSLQIPKAARASNARTAS
ncbi:hypothetical protein RHECNPAF_930068 [Rhizobium etli CNPAF512]|nr:hypothetical protein RHECNPAF_930068 [Rhizobium etli CNPAF512]